MNKNDVVEFDKVYADEQVRRSNHPIRKLIKYFYIRYLLADIRGMALDVGCGAGQLLRKLPPGSLGLEINQFLIDTLRKKNLNVVRYDMNEDDFGFVEIPCDKFQTLVISHVMEHFDDASVVINKIFKSAARLGIQRIVIVVPGWLGYLSDKTHRTFINSAYVKHNNLETSFGYTLIKMSHFPMPAEIFGRFFIYQELKLVYDKTEKA